MNYYKWIDINTTSLNGKTVAITGATGGIGSVLCDYLAYIGANLICLDRNFVKSNSMINDLKIKYHDLIATHITIDLENFDTVKKVTNELKNQNIDYLVLNAGAYKIPRYKCDTGYNNVFQINFLSQFYIAKELAPSITSRKGRVVAVSSIAHNYSKIDFDDIDFSTRNASSKIYGNAKRFLTAALYNLFNGDSTLSIVHPGITLTNITAHFPKIIFDLIKFPMKVIFMPAKKAALCVLCGIFYGCDKFEWIGPKFFNIWGMPQKKQLNTIKESEMNFVAQYIQKLF